MNQLIRVQVYLEPQNLTILDQVAKEENISRSQAIRDAIDKTIKTRTTRALKRRKKAESILMEMAGIEVSKTGTLGLNVDEIYLED